MVYIYFAVFVIAVLSIVYIDLNNYKNIEPFFWGISMIIPVSALGYLSMMLAGTEDGVVIAQNLAFADQTILAPMFFACVLKEMRIHFNRYAKLAIYSFNFLIYMTTILPISRSWYYADITLLNGRLGRIVKMTPGPLMVFHRVVLVAMVAYLIYVRIKYEIQGRKFASRVVRPYFMVIGIGIAVNALQEIMDIYYNFMPVLYGVGILFLAINYRKKYIHDIGAIINNVIGNRQICGYVAFDNEHRVVAANDYALKVFPELVAIPVDTVIPSDNTKMYNLFEEGQSRLAEGDREPKFEESNGKKYRVSAEYFYMNKNGSTSGVLFKIEDYTEEQQHLDFVDSYDVNLNHEVDKRLKHLRKIQRKVETGVADIVESRDSVTGSHVKRTSDIMKIITDTMAENKTAGITYEMAEDMVRAAAFHDLGKIAIRDAILLKPGKLTEEEYAEVKKHSSIGADMLTKMLEDVEERHFTEVAVNMARYHHERYDGTGYPNKLKGEEIPLEARVMAMADVYDALVTERCYKEVMSFEEAAREMMNVMGTQLDPMLKKLFNQCKAKMESYYRNIL